jgi:hypothetical protein
MKKIILFCAFILLAAIAVGQNSIYKQKDAKLITSTTTTAGKDSVTYTLQAEWDWSIQILPALGAGCDSIYTSVQIYISNSDADAVWTAISDINDTYTASIDTLVTGNIATGSAWLTYSTTPFQHSKIKVVLKCLTKTGEDNTYNVYFLAKPDYVWSKQDR